MAGVAEGSLCEKQERRGAVFRSFLNLETALRVVGREWRVVGRE